MSQPNTGTSEVRKGVLFKRIFGALAAYGGAKASVLVAPLLLARVLPLTQYGLLEYSLSVGQLIAVGLSLGMHGGVPYFLLRRRQLAYMPAFALHVILVSSICIAFSVLATLQGYTGARLICLIAGVTVAQLFTAARYQSSGRPMLSSIAESCLYLILLAFAGSVGANLLPRNLHGLCWILTAYLILILAWNFVRFPRHTPQLRLWRTYKGAARYGITVLPATFANVGLVSLGRTLVGLSATLEETALYSLVYRLSVPLVAIHQFLTNFYFKRLYEGGVREFERYFASLTILILAGVAGLAWLGPFVGQALTGANAIVLNARTGLFVLMGLTMTLWAQLSLMELFMNREARALVQVPGIVAGCLVTIMCILLPQWMAVGRVDNVALFQGLGFAVAVLWIFHVSGVPRPRWPLARALVLGESVALAVCWLFIVIG